MANSFPMGTRRFGRVNWLGLYTLARRETMRFLTVWTQTILAPLVTAGLFLAIFTIAIGPTRGEVMGVPFAEFLAPGLMMMTVVQNAFANASSSLMIAKVQGNIVDTLMPPLSPGELVAGYVAASVARGIIVAVAVVIMLSLLLGHWPAHPVLMLVYVALGSAFLAGFGLIAAIYSTKFDQMAAITNFVVTPLAFLSGTFYAIDDMPGILRAISLVNPVYYLIDGARYGVIGQSGSSIWLGLVICLVSTGAILTLTWHWFRTGYRLKS